LDIVVVNEMREREREDGRKETKKTKISKANTQATNKK
jgi:hypothetical protein